MITIIKPNGLYEYGDEQQWLDHCEEVIENELY